MIIFYLLILLGLLALHFCTRYSHKGRVANKLPGLKPYPFFGNILYFNASDPCELWEMARRLTKQFYPITRLWGFRDVLISIVHPHDAEILLTSQKVIEKGYMYDYLHPWLKTGLLTSTGDKWRHRRKMLTPAFHFNILKKYVAMINEEGEKCIVGLKKEGPESVQSLVHFSSVYTLNVICESAMGVTLDKMDKKISDQYKKAIHNFGYLVFYRVCRPYILDWMMKPVWKMGCMQRDIVKVLHDFTSKVVQERREYHKSTGNKYLTGFEDVDSDDTSLGSKRRLAMLDLLLAAEQNGLIDNEGIKEEVDTFTFEGHDTTGMALTYTLMLLAENKEAQDLARIEVTEILDRCEGKLTMANLQELNYLERCIKESLRLYPPVSTILRYTSEDLQLKHGVAPAGTTIVLHIFDVHRDPNFWTEPEKFDPDRFLPERSMNRHPFAYIPFSAGPRNCIGQRFAMMELKSLVARILYNFYLEPIVRSSDIKLLADIVIRPVAPVYTKFVRINKK